MIRYFLCVLTCIGLSAPQTFAAGQSSTNYAIPRDAINNGGGEMSSTNYRMVSAIGDSVASGTIGSVAYRLDSGFLGQVTVSPAVLTLLSVISKKIHGATPFSITVDHTQPVTGNVTVEPRAIGAGHTLVFHFDSPVTVAGAATALDSFGVSVGTAAVSLPGNGDVQVTLTNVADGKRVKITLTGLNSSGTASASLGFLLGDINGNRSVTPADVAAVKARAGKAADATTFVFDLNASGTISATDITAVKSRASAGKVLSAQ